jgi:hypothetical protein
MLGLRDSGCDRPASKIMGSVGVAEVVDPKQAEVILERAATRAASTEAISPLWEQRARELEKWTSNRVAIAAFGTALLAKATNPKIDPLSLSHKSGPAGYQPRTLAKNVLAAKSTELNYRLGTPGPDPLAGSPWFGDIPRIDQITKWRKPMRGPADRLISWLSGLTADDAEDALVAFLRVRMDVAAQYQKQRELRHIDAAQVSYRELVTTLQPFVEARSEDGRRGAAVVAATFASAGYDVVARPVNDPGQVDIDVRDGHGTLVVGIEVKQKPATAQDALDIAEGAGDAGASKAVLCALDPSQVPLDDERLVALADKDSEIALEIVYSVSRLLRLGMFSSAVPRDEFLADFPRHMAHFLAELDASEDARVRWKAVADRWTS